MRNITSMPPEVEWCNRNQTSGGVGGAVSSSSDAQLWKIQNSKKPSPSLACAGASPEVAASFNMVRATAAARATIWAPNFEARATLGG